jgi:hypothetical protein
VSVSAATAIGVPVILVIMEKRRKAEWGGRKGRS